MKLITFLTGFTQGTLMWALFSFLLGFACVMAPAGLSIKEAEARVVRTQPIHHHKPHHAPRRTVRRHHRRHHIVHHHRHIAVGAYVAVLPTYCTTLIAGGNTYYVCDDVYYQPYYDGGDLVYVVVVKP